MRRSEQGFLAFLLGNPMLALAAALAIAFVFAGLAAKGYKSQRDSARVERAAVKAEYAGFVIAVKRRGEEQEKETAAREEKDRATLKAIRAGYQADLARRDADLRRLRERPPADPSGREVPVLACGPAGADGTAAQLVPLAEYRALEERSYDDALRLTALQRWVVETRHPVQ